MLSSSSPEHLELSLNEIEMLAMKAARGAGLAWGVAEDTGRAAVWVARRMTGWAALLRTLLARAHETTLIAAWLADRTAAGEDSDTGDVANPLWALPGLLSIATRTLTVEIGPYRVTTGAGVNPSADATIETLAALPRAAIRVRHCEDATALPCELAPMFQRGAVALADWQALNALAALTYVEATERSRIAGAGPAGSG